MSGVEALPAIGIQPSSGRRGRLARRKARIAVALMAPAMLLLLAFLLLPLASVIGLSLTDYQLGAPEIAFVGWTNYRELAADPVFWTSLGNTLLYAAVVVPASFALGLGTAVLIQSGTGLRGFYRAACFLPVMASLIATAMVWEFMLHPSFGLVNHVLRSVGLEGHNWLHDSATALPVLMVIGIWQQFGFCMVLFLSGLVSIPRSLYEAASMDGAAFGWSRFRLVTWPMLGPVALFVAVISAIRAFQVFDTVHALTGGGPGKATEVMLQTIYAEGFEFFRTGRAAAITVVFIILVLGVSLVKQHILEKRVHYA
jgi:multiple sugar transport system permease protein